MAVIRSLSRSPHPTIQEVRQKLRALTPRERLLCLKEVIDELVDYPDELETRLHMISLLAMVIGDLAKNTVTMAH